MRKFLYIFIVFSLTYQVLSYYPVKIETRILNQDKKYLNADLYAIDTTTTKPVILIQTPYNKNLYRLKGESGISGSQLPYDSINYNYVIVDWRGFYSNKSIDSAGYNRGFDGYDAVEWIATQKWSNGKIGTWGGSALGMIQFQTAAQNPPHLVCAAPFIKDYQNKYEDYYYQGVLRKEHTESLEKLGFITVNLVTSHPDKDKSWQLAENISQLAPKIKVPMFLGTGWFDHYPGAVIRAFDDLKSTSDVNVRNQHKLVVGPWAHSDIGKEKQGDLSFPEAVDLIPEMSAKFFDYYLRGSKNNFPGYPTVQYFEMGSNKWVNTQDWSTIPRKSDTLYLNRDKKLLTTTPPPIMSPLAEPPDTIIFNPKDPSPTIGGSRFNPFDKNALTGPLDISKMVESRSDVVLYSTGLLDKPLSLNGSIEAYLYVSTDKTDTDFGVRLVDVYPDGRSIIFTQGISRLRFREGTDKEILANPKEVYKIKISLEPLSHVFLPGHKFQLDFSSSNYPMFALNLNNGGAMYEAGDTLTALNLIHHTAEQPSMIIIPSEKATSNFSEAKNNTEFYVYPNPATDMLYMNFPEEALSSQASILYDVFGRTLMENDGESIDVSCFSTGVYYIKSQFGIRKFIKI